MQSLVNMFWQGKMSHMEVNCIQSFLDNGVSVNVFSYDNLELPNGAALQDAAQILPKEDLFYFEGSPSGFSNIFRYKLLLERGGWWVDTDVIMLDDKLPESEYFWAWQDLEYINGAVLRFPPSDPLCEELLSQSIEKAKNLSVWGELGPQLLTKVLAKESVRNDGTTENTYPIHWLEAHYLWFPEFIEIVEARIQNASFLHLWHAMYGQMGIDLNCLPPKGGFFDDFLGNASSTENCNKGARKAVHDYLSGDWVLEYCSKTMGRSIELPVLEATERQVMC